MLIVDDQPSMAGMVALMVAVLGYKAIQSHSPENVLNRIKSETVDLLLSDYGMPSMNGLELVAQLRKLGCLFPVILMSDNAGVIDRIRARQLGVITILEKPFGLDIIKEALEAALKRVIPKRKVHEGGICFILLVCLGIFSKWQNRNLFGLGTMERLWPNTPLTLTTLLQRC